LHAPFLSSGHRYIASQARLAKTIANSIDP
jgi:hypothetical protein